LKKLLSLEKSPEIDSINLNKDALNKNMWEKLVKLIKEKDGISNHIRHSSAEINHNSIDLNKLRASDTIKHETVGRKPDDP